MFRNRIIAGLCISAAFFANAAAQDTSELPDIAAALLKAAYETNDREEIDAVRKAVAKVFPDYVDAIDADANAYLASLEPQALDADIEGGAVRVADASDNVDGNAEEKDTRPKGFFRLKSWDGKITAGGNWASGNSDSLAVGFGIDARKELDRFTHNIKGFVDLAESDLNGDNVRVTSQKRWGLSYQLDLNLSDDTFAFTRFSYEEDQFSGYDYRLFGGGGLGHFLFKDEAFKWKIEGAPGYRYSPIDDSPEIEQEFAGFGATEIDWVIHEDVTAEQDFNVTWSASTTTFLSKTALTTKLMDALSTSLAFEYRYETDPPAGRKNTDQIARASLTYGF